MEIILQWFSIDGILLLCIGIIAAMIGMIFGAAGFVLVPAMLLMGVPIHATVAANKFATGFSSFTTVITFMRTRKVRLLDMVPFMVLAMLGGLAGAFLATRLSEHTMNIVACTSLIFTFIFVVQGNKNLKITTTDEEALPKTKILPFFIGIYDGGFGPGSGSMYITYFLKNKCSYSRAAALTRFLIFASCAGGFVFYYFYGLMDWGLAIPITVGSIIGSHIGIRVIPHLKAKWIQVVLPIIFIVLIGQVVFELFV